MGKYAFQSLLHYLPEYPGRPFQHHCLSLNLSQKTQSFLFYLKHPKKEMKKSHFFDAAYKM